MLNKLIKNVFGNENPTLWQKVLYVGFIILILGGAIFYIIMPKKVDNDSKSNTNTQIQEHVTNTKTENKSATTHDRIADSTPKEKYEIIGNLTTERDMYSYYINGTIKNNTNKKLNYIQVEFNLYDSEGNQIGTAIDNLNNLEPNGTWKFRAVNFSGESDKVASYKFIEISAF